MKRIKFPQHNKTDNITAINTTSTIAKFSYTLAVVIHSQSLQVNLIAFLT